MIAETQELIDSYVKWIRDRTALRSVGASIVEITTPFLDRHNDRVQVYLKYESNRILLSDDGYTLSDLEDSGCPVDSSPRRRELLKEVCNGFGVTIKGNALTIEASVDSFADKKFRLIQAIMAVDDLFYLSSATVASVFYDDVSQWLAVNNIRYSSRVKLSGKSGFDHMFDFIIPKSSIEPERVIKIMNNPRKSSAKDIVFSWIDTKETREPSSELLAVLNDTDISISSATIDCLNSYDITPVFWSKRKDAIEKFAA